MQGEERASESKTNGGEVEAKKPNEGKSDLFRSFSFLLSGSAFFASSTMGELGLVAPPTMSPPCMYLAVAADIQLFSNP